MLFICAITSSIFKPNHKIKTNSRGEIMKVTYIIVAAIIGLSMSANAGNLLGHLKSSPKEILVFDSSVDPLSGIGMRNGAGTKITLPEISLEEETGWDCHFMYRVFKSSGSKIHSCTLMPFRERSKKYITISGVNYSYRVIATGYNGLDSSHYMGLNDISAKPVSWKEVSVLDLELTSISEGKKAGVLSFWPSYKTKTGKKVFGIELRTNYPEYSSGSIIGKTVSFY